MRGSGDLLQAGHTPCGGPARPSTAQAPSSCPTLSSPVGGETEAQAPGAALPLPAPHRRDCPVRRSTVPRGRAGGLGTGLRPGRRADEAQLCSLKRDWERKEGQDGREAALTASDLPPNCPPCPSASMRSLPAGGTRRSPPLQGLPAVAGSSRCPQASGSFSAQQALASVRRHGAGRRVHGAEAKPQLPRLQLGDSDMPPCPHRQNGAGNTTWGCLGGVISKTTHELWVTALPGRRVSRAPGGQRRSGRTVWAVTVQGPPAGRGNMPPRGNRVAKAASTSPRICPEKDEAEARQVQPGTPSCPPGEAAFGGQHYSAALRGEPGWQRGLSEHPRPPTCRDPGAAPPGEACVSSGGGMGGRLGGAPASDSASCMPTSDPSPGA